jgi:oligosaccharide repeat unit polymerase
LGARHHAILHLVSSVLPAVFSGVTFLYAVRALPLLHPVQLWSGSWAVATSLYELRLLPYRSLSWLTAGLICGSVVTFAIGVWLGGRLARRTPAANSTPQDAAVVRLSAWLSFPLLGLALAAFLAQLISRYGASRVLRLSPEVKLYLSSGEAPLAGTYVDFALAATVLCALTGARSAGRREQRRWLVAAMLCAGTIYFSTGRAFIAVALVAGLAVLALAGLPIDRRRLGAMALAATAVIVVSFVGLGSLLGKTYSRSGMGAFDNFFSRHPVVSSLALPYQDLTASIPALDVLVNVSTTWGRAHGCATVPPACGLIRKLGVPAVRVPVAGPFTKAPLRWNAYTFLDRFLIDGGTALALIFVVATGVLAGYFWARARAGSAAGIVVYALGVPAVLGVYRQNLLGLVGIAALIAAGLLFLAGLVSRRRTAYAGRLTQTSRLRLGE